MPHLTRRGFTLVELLIGLVLMGIVSAGIYRVLVTNQQIYQAQTQRIEMQQNIRAAAAILPAELREISASEGDIIAMSATGIQIRAMRQLGLLCAPPLLGGANAVLFVRQTPLYGLRDFAGRDSIFVYYEGDDATRLDDGWVRGRITSIAPGVCPDASPAWLLTTTLFFDGALNQQPVTGNILSGSPVRGFEHVTYQLYTSPADGRRYIGMQVYSAGIQPLVGPLTSNGLTLAYFDSTGAATATANRVALIRMTLRAETRQAFRQLDRSLARSVDSVTTWVALRNNLRY
jgi:prepilin-type N-terminal cleavage/methylation domain-containing protein